MCSTLDQVKVKVSLYRCRASCLYGTSVVLVHVLTFCDLLCQVTCVVNVVTVLLSSVTVQWCDKCAVCTGKYCVTRESRFYRLIIFELTMECFY